MSRIVSRLTKTAKYCRAYFLATGLESALQIFHSTCPCVDTVVTKLNSGIAIAPTGSCNFPGKNAQFCSAEAASVSRDKLALLQSAISGEHADSRSRKVVFTVIDRDHVLDLGRFARRTMLSFTPVHYCGSPRADHFFLTVCRKKYSSPGK